METSKETQPSFIDQDQIVFHKDEITIEKRIGKGAFGSVYKAKFCKTEQDIAVKKVMCGILKEKDESKQNEYRILSKLHHPCIVNYYGLSFRARELWILIEYCDLGSLDHMMHIARRAFTIEETSYLLKQVVTALAYLHAQNIIFLDLKSSNVLLNSRAEVKLCDFNVATPADDITYLVCGTPRYMAPEMWQKAGYNHKADIWSLGILAYECVEIYTPFKDIDDRDVKKEIEQKGAPRFKSPNKYSSDFINFVNSCLELDPLKRPSATELLKHSFLANASDASIMASFIYHYLENKEQLAITQAQPKVEQTPKLPSQLESTVCRKSIHDNSVNSNATTLRRQSTVSSSQLTDSTIVRRPSIGSNDTTVRQSSITDKTIRRQSSVALNDTTLRQSRPTVHHTRSHSVSVTSQNRTKKQATGVTVLVPVNKLVPYLNENADDEKISRNSISSTQLAMTLQT